MAALHVSGESWAHSLLDPASGGDLGTQEVETCTLSAILDTARTNHPSRDIVVTLNVEGFAGTVLLATQRSDWERVVDLWCEFEANERHS